MGLEKQFSVYWDIIQHIKTKVMNENAKIFSAKGEKSGTKNLLVTMEEISFTGGQKYLAIVSRGKNLSCETDVTNISERKAERVGDLLFTALFAFLL